MTRYLLDGGPWHGQFRDLRQPTATVERLNTAVDPPDLPFTQRGSYQPTGRRFAHWPILRFTGWQPAVPPRQVMPEPAWDREDEARWAPR